MHQYRIRLLPVQLLPEKVGLKRLRDEAFDWHGASAPYSRALELTRLSGGEKVWDVLVAFNEYATGTLLVLELVGTFVFALSGAAAGGKQRLDLSGAPVLSFVAVHLMARLLAIMVATAGGLWLFLEHPAALSMAIVR